MFERDDRPRLFALPPGVDFSTELVAGLRQRLRGAPPDAMARATLIVNTRRMARRLREVFDAGPPSFLPRICTVTSLDAIWPMPQMPPALAPLQRKLELARLISALLDRETDLAPRSAIFDLSDSLSSLMDEMHGEGVGMDALDALDISDQSGHWARLTSFLAITREFDARAQSAGAEARNRRIVGTLIDRWQRDPPADPVILAGSTGSRGTTQLLLRAITALPQGAVVLPGYDFDMPAPAWEALDTGMGGEDHPQYRFRALHHTLDLAPGDVRPWTDGSPPATSRNAVVSMALRPAPVTDQWRVEGPDLPDLDTAMKDVTLLEAPGRRIEALTIAMRLREAAETGTKAALITPDRDLTRQVAAALDRWRILPDDSAGTPLHHTAPGRFLRHVAALPASRLSTEALLTLLKHPLTHQGGTRGPHLRLTRELELWLRRKGIPFPTQADLSAWAAIQSDGAAPEWVAWLCETIFRDPAEGQHPLTRHLAEHLALARRIAWGATEPDDGWPPAWAEKAGPPVLLVMAELERQAAHGGALGATEYANLLDNLLSSGEWRDTERADPLIRIWGTIEARVQGAELVILAGLNEGTWPEPTGHDPWLNRVLRKQAGLLLPERRIGLAAHDFQQAIGAPEVWITRSIRSDEAQTVMSRWLNRLINLLDGLPEQGGQTALAAMRARGQHWLARADTLETVEATPPARRPAPVPPVHLRPATLPVTGIERLIRDPYAVYARYVLRLSPLAPVQRLADPLMRGTAIHDILEAFIRATADDDSGLTPTRFFEIADPILAERVPWGQVRLQWRAGLERVIDDFLADEVNRRILARPAALEVPGRAELTSPPFTLTAKADRIDIAADGGLVVYDYKTGKPPTKPQQKKFSKQLLLEAAMLERGAFAEIPADSVTRAAYIGLGSDAGEVEAPLDDVPPDKTWAELAELIASYLDPGQGYASRRAMGKISDTGDYDQLARFGEWDVTAAPDLIELRLPDG
ncbi:double-strand break repair protein AddB [Roseovarius sp. SCSIO 43702]|uniref:double-strand break repair protein AddB n=1 Tax=Roseovarius sp. SCSIO 43702 TaxID=2823043 RepID=UPI001C7394D6|nr:double-strand break repair protein AddB [Roseovarius sp. SCSIO 43702]QYX56977.1 double-strand break repair protein AddB [Roseovarius sp. SCSIO 43702]